MNIGPCYVAYQCNDYVKIYLTNRASLLMYRHLSLPLKTTSTVTLGAFWILSTVNLVDMVLCLVRQLYLGLPSLNIA